jgi:Fe-S-cluster-containing dehydrogenase component
MKQEEKFDQSRRDFLKITTITAAAAACGSLACGCSSKSEHNHNKVKLLSQNGEIVEIDSQHLHTGTHDHMGMATKEAARMGIPGRKFVMVIDLARCKDARKCVSACQKMHHLPEDKEWLKVLLMKDSDKGAPYWMPKTCFHCDNPPCVKVCPVDATFKRQDGLVLIDNDRCIGCKFCMAACPYSTRVFNWEDPTPQNATYPYTPETSVPSKVGTVEKCDFCPDMVRQGLLPDCVSACPNGTFYFGDENEDTVTNGDETVSLSQLIKDRSGYRYMEELGTQPRVYYLPPKDRLFPVERGYENLPEKTQERYKSVMEGKK